MCLNADEKDATEAKYTSAVLHRDTRHVPKKAVGGQGSYIFLEDGQKFLDATGGAAVSCLGHGNEQVNKAVINQINQLSYCYSVFFSTPAAEDLARMLVDSTGGQLTKLYVVNSGTSACQASCVFQLLFLFFG